MGATLTYSGALVQRTCWCGVRHAIPAELSRSADLDKSTSVYCPLGHSWVSSTHEKREAEQLRERLEEQRRRTEAARDLLKAEERSHAATRGHLTRSKKRAAAGVCPHPACHRHFANLERHVANKHPELLDQVRAEQA